MFKPTEDEINFIGFLLECFFYGIYSGVFAMYLEYQTSKRDTTKTQHIIRYSICGLYVLSVALFACDIAFFISPLLGKSPESILPIVLIRPTLFGFCDFIAQFILIYRCWIVWGCNIRIVIIPSILALAFLGTWLACGESTYISSGQYVTPGWGSSVLLTSLTMSLAVNALVTGLVVYRIFKVFQEVKATSDDRILGATGGGKLRRIMFILIESGMALFSIQLARLVVTIVGTEAAYRAFVIISAIHGIINGITPTIILVRTSMGLSFDDEKSMEKAAIESLRFASSHPSSVPETGSIRIEGRDSRDVDDIEV